MKKPHFTYLFFSLSLLFFAFQSQAQTVPEDAFVGSWKVKAYGLPQGDTDMIIQFEKKEGKLSGGIVDTVTQEVNPFTSIETGTNTVKAFFTAQGFNAFLTLEKKDESNVTGSIMDMFKMEGAKAK
jgi:hypothetical protein